MRISDWSSDVCSSDLLLRPWCLAAYIASSACLSRVCASPASSGKKLTPIDAVICNSVPSSRYSGVSITCTIFSATRNTSSFRTEEHTSEIQSLIRISYAVICLKKKRAAYEQAYNTGSEQLQNST